MRKLFGLVVVLMLFGAVAQAKSIYLVRHAEKVDNGSKDPVLTLQGQQRAQDLATMLSAAGIVKVYATDYHRTQMTAKPMADYLGIGVTSYDPGELSTFAQELIAQDDNVLVVGHSNTTPMLTYLLADKPVFNLDETDFDNVFQVILEADAVSLNVLKSLPSKATQTLSQFIPKSDQFFTGKLVFNRLFKDEVVGQSTHIFKTKGNEYILSEYTEIESMNIKADIKTAVVADTLMPSSLTVTGSMGTPVDIQLTWQADVVNGHSSMARESFKRQGMIKLNQKLRPQAFERTSAIMLAHLIPVSENNPLLINWFNGYDGDQHLIEISYHGEEQITVPAGTFDTYKIEYSGGAPSQSYWIDKKQAKVVKIDVIKSPWSYELTDFVLDK